MSSRQIFVNATESSNMGPVTSVRERSFVSFERTNRAGRVHLYIKSNFVLFPEVNV